MYFKKATVVQSKIRSNVRRVIRLSLSILLITAPIMGRTAWAQMAAGNATQDYTLDVDPFIGVDWGGNTFVGSAIHSGWSRWVPICRPLMDAVLASGYSSYGEILGFSHLHLSGAQGKYENILVMPFIGTLDLSDIKSPRTNEVNRVGSAPHR